MMNNFDGNFQWIDAEFDHVYQPDPKLINVETDEIAGAPVALNVEALLDETGLVEIAPAVSMAYSNINVLQTNYALKPSSPKKLLELQKEIGERAQSTRVVPAVEKVSQSPQLAFPTVNLNQFDGRAAAKRAKRSRHITMYLLLGAVVASIVLFGVAPWLISLFAN